MIARPSNGGRAPLRVRRVGAKDEAAILNGLHAAAPHSGLGRRAVTRPITFGPWLFAGLFAAMTVSPSFRANASESDAIHPSTAIPNVAAEASGQYYILFLKWSRDVSVGPVTARATYLDPPLYLAWLRQEFSEHRPSRL